MNRLQLLAFVALVGCGPETECFGYTDAPEASEVEYDPGTSDYNGRPQTLDEAEVEAWRYFRGVFAGSSQKVMCLLDEGTVTCSENWHDGSHVDEPGQIRTIACVWSHPEDQYIPAGHRTKTFSPDFRSDEERKAAGCPDDGGPWSCPQAPMLDDG